MFKWCERCEIRLTNSKDRICKECHKSGFKGWKKELSIAHKPILLAVALLVFMALSFAQIPTAGINPKPVINKSSDIQCGLISGAANTSILAELFINGNNTANFSGVYPTNLTATVGNYTFDTLGSAYLVCYFDGTVSQYSENYNISALFWGNDDTDGLFTSVLLTLAILSLVFAYLHVNSQSYLWYNLWFFMACLMILAAIMAIIAYAQDKAAAGIEGIGLALFTGFVWVFIISLILFVYTTLINLLLLVKKAVKGED